MVTIKLKGKLPGLNALGLLEGMRFEAETIEGSETSLYFFYNNNMCVVSAENYEVINTKNK